MMNACTAAPAGALTRLGHGVIGLAAAQDAASSASTDATTPSTTFRPVEGGGNNQSGETLLVAAYAVMWLLAFGLILATVRKQRKLDADVLRLRSDMAKARKYFATQQSADKQSAGPQDAVDEDVED